MFNTTVALCEVALKTRAHQLCGSRVTVVVLEFYPGGAELRGPPHQAARKPLCCWGCLQIDTLDLAEDQRSSFGKSF